jgi:hypothetical protein
MANKKTYSRSDLENKSYDEMWKEGSLAYCRLYFNDIYKRVYEERFGRKPVGDDPEPGKPDGRHVSKPTQYPNRTDAERVRQQHTQATKGRTLTHDSLSEMRSTNTTRVWALMDRGYDSLFKEGGLDELYALSHNSYLELYKKKYGHLPNEKPRAK